MKSIEFRTKRVTQTQYQLVNDWRGALEGWFQNHASSRTWDHIALLTDENVWALYGESINATFELLGLPLVRLTLPSGEDSKDFSSLPSLIETLTRHRVHRRDLLVCFGGGLCADLGGLLAFLYMRGLNYINVPTSLMGQIDAAIGGKVGANFGLRKNLLGAFHHPLLVVIDPTFLATLPNVEFNAALAEALKLAIIRDDDFLLEILAERREALAKRDPTTLWQLIDRCVNGKLELLAPDPFENDFDRALNLGHAMAHSLERLPIMPHGRRPLHGEAVALGLASVIRYAFLSRLCPPERATRLLGILSDLELPVSPGRINLDLLRTQLTRIKEHRGGRLRLAVPAEKGVSILADADLELLMECLYPRKGSLL